MDEYQDAIKTLVEDGKATGDGEGVRDVEMGDGGVQEGVDREQGKGERGKRLKRKVRIVEYPQEIQ
jgi:hypothetical protein